MRSDNQNLNNYLQKLFPQFQSANMLDTLTVLQQEYRPDLSYREAMEKMIWTLIEERQDHTLDFLWSQYLYQSAHNRAA
jgi:hypothetical protein